MKYDKSKLMKMIGDISPTQFEDACINENCLSDIEEVLTHNTIPLFNKLIATSFDLVALGIIYGIRLERKKRNKQ
jgi:hypothetical protein